MARKDDRDEDRGRDRDRDDDRGRGRDRDDDRGRGRGKDEERSTRGRDDDDRGRGKDRDRDDDRGRGKDRDRDDRPSGGSKYVYKERSAEDIEARASQQGGMFDSIFKSEYPVFKPNDGGNLIRYFPPTWDDHRHYGFEIHVHNNIGPDGATYLCPEKMQGKPCAVCQARADLPSDASDDDIRELRPTKRVVVWLVDRDSEDTGPQLWSEPWMNDRDIAALCKNKRTGEILLIDHPEKGYDVSFEKTGAKARTRYGSFRIERDPSPLARKESTQEKWMAYVVANPIPETLNHFSSEDLDRIFRGKARERDEDDRGSRRSKDRDDRGRGRDDRKRVRDGDDEEERGGGTRRRVRDEEEERPKDEEERSARGRDRDEDRGRGKDRDRDDDRDRDRDEPDDPPDRGAKRADRDEPRGRGRDEPEEKEEEEETRRPPRQVGKGKDREPEESTSRRGKDDVTDEARERLGRLRGRSGR